MKREIHHIEPWSAVRVGFFVGLLGGFLFGLLNGAIVKYLSGVVGSQMMTPEMTSVVNLSGGALFALAVVTSLISSLLFALLGFISALFYNIIAGLFGGLEIRVLEEEISKTAEPSRAGFEEEEPRHE